MNLRENNVDKTINIYNVVEQLNSITDVVNGSNSGNLSDVQLKNINDGIKNLKDKLGNLEIDVSKYIDEAELEEALKEIKSNLKNSVTSNDFTSSLNDLTTKISTLTGKINDLQGKKEVDLTGYAKSNEIENKVNDILTDKVSGIETNIVSSVNSEIDKKITNKLSGLNLDNKIGKTVDDKIDSFKTTFKTDIDSDIDDKISKFRTNLDNDYFKLKSNNTITGENTFNNTTNFIGNVNIRGDITLPILTKIKANTFSLGNNDFIVENNDNISIGFTGKKINLITDKLLLNGDEFKTDISSTLSNYATFDGNNTFSGLNYFTKNNLILGNKIVRTPEIVYEGNLSIMRISDDNFGLQEDNKIDYSLFLRNGMNGMNGNYNFIVFYVSTGDINNYDNMDRIRGTRNIEGGSDVFIVPFGKVFISNKYTASYSNDYYFRLIFDDMNKTIRVFYKMYSEHIVVSKIIVF